MRIINTLFLAGMCSFFLVGCANNEEAIDVDKPQYQGATTIDLTTGQVYDEMGKPSDYASLARGVSSPGVEIYSLDEAMDTMPPSEAYTPKEKGAVGNAGIEISPIGQPDLGYVNDLNSIDNYVVQKRPVTSLSPNIYEEAGDYAIIKAQGDAPVRIYFAPGSSSLDDDDLNIISSFSQKYNTNQRKLISVEGYASEHTGTQDSMKRKEDNLKVSMDRAYAVARALIYNGIPANAINTAARGEEGHNANISALDDNITSNRRDIYSPLYAE